MIDKYTKNSPKVLNAEGKPIVPGTYEIQKVAIIRNRNSPELDITELVTDMVFTEELFSPVMVAKLTVSDTANSERKVFKTNSEYFQGYELLNITIRFIEYDNDKILNFQLSVREYGDFELDSEGVYTGVFVITAVDNFAVLSRLQQISFAVGQPHDTSKRGKSTIEHVALIFKKYLNLDDASFDYTIGQANKKTKCNSKIRALIPYCTPLQAVEWLRTKSFDADKSPFFIYGIFNDLNIKRPVRKIMAKSWNWLIDTKNNPVYKTFRKKYNTVTDNDDKSRYNIEKQRLIEFTTNTTKNELSKFLQGEYNSIVKTIDYAAGVFDYNDSLEYMPELVQTLSDTNNLKQYAERYDKSIKLRNDYLKSLNANNVDIYQPALLSHRPLPLYDNIPGDLYDSSQIKNFNSRAIPFFRSKIQNEQSEITVYGDINLSPGKILRLIVDDDANNNIRDDSPRNSPYLIITSVHSFSDGRYINNLRLVQLPTK